MTTFSDGAAYERFMGRWSSAVGTIFLDWVAPSTNARWLDIGCGTGVFTELVLDRCTPSTVDAVDPSSEQVELARSKPVAGRVDFHVADATKLPFPDGAFDVVAAALVINFIANRSRAIAEMRRVGRPGGVVAGYVWDYTAGGSPSSPIRDQLSRMGAKAPVMHGADDSRLAAVSLLFSGAGLKDIVTRTIEVTMTFPNFADFWQTQTPAYSPTGKAMAALSESERATLANSVRESLPPSADGSVAFTARANAIKACVPE